MKSISIIGLGSRGKNTYLMELLKHDGVVVSHVCDIDQQKINETKKIIPDAICYLSEEEFFIEKRSDAIIIANDDSSHTKTLLKAIEQGYDILLEKPITKHKSELDLIKKMANQHKARIMVCHPLRYSTQFVKIKQLIDEKRIGDIVGINMVENIGNQHIAHSYVRGNWRNNEKSSPLILAKSCHDLDYLSWIIGSKYKTVDACGDLKYFNEKYMPSGASLKCNECKYQETCIYNAEKVYSSTMGTWPTDTFYSGLDISELREVLKKTQYGTCVYNIKDHDTIDHLSALISYDNGVSVTLTVTGMSQFNQRTMQIYGTTGQIDVKMKDNSIEIIDFHMDASEHTVEKIYPQEVAGGHGGADPLLVRDFVKFIFDEEFIPRTNFNESLDSHYLAYEIDKCIEEKRQND